MKFWPLLKISGLYPEHIFTLLCQIDLLTTNGKTLTQVCKELGRAEQSRATISDQDLRWYKGDQPMKYKDLELENATSRSLLPIFLCER